jgi:hypothetical protein
VIAFAAVFAIAEVVVVAIADCTVEIEVQLA